MWHRWFNGNFTKLWEYFLCSKKTKIMTLFNNSSPPNHIFHHYGEYHDACALLSSAHKQGSANVCSTSVASRAYVSLFTCRGTLDNGGRSDLKEKNCWIKLLFLFSLGLGTFQLCCCLCRVRKLSDFIKNILCSEDERRSYGFGMTWGWVINDRIFIFGWIIPLMWISGEIH